MGMQFEMIDIKTEGLRRIPEFKIGLGKSRQRELIEN